MFHNIGRKIKGLAIVFAMLGMVASIVEGIQLIENTAYDDNGMWIIIGFVVIIGGSVLSWISAFILYGFGELVDNSTIIAAVLQKDSGVGDLISQSSPLNEKGADVDLAPSAADSQQRLASLDEARMQLSITEADYWYTLNMWRKNGLITEQDYQERKSTK